MWQYTLTPESSGGYFQEGDTVRRAAAEKRLEEFSIAIEKDPHNATLYLERNRVHESLRYYDRAIEDLSVALRLDLEKSFFYLYLRHRLHFFKGDLANSLRDIDEAFRTAPAGYTVDYVRSLAFMHRQLGQTGKAIAALNATVSSYPDNAEAYLVRAAFYEGIGLLKEATVDVSQAIQLEPKARQRYRAYHDRAGLYAKMKQFTEALADCNRCISEQPGEWTHYRIRSEVYAAMGKTALAKSDYNKSMGLNPLIADR